MAQFLQGYRGVYNGPGPLSGLTGEFGGSLGGGMQEFLPQGTTGSTDASGNTRNFLNGNEISVAIPLGAWSRYGDDGTGATQAASLPALPPPGVVSGIAPPAGTPTAGGVQPAPPVDAAALNAPPPDLSPAQLIAALTAQLGATAPRIKTGIDPSYAAALQKILAQLVGGTGQQYGGVQGG